MVAFAFQFPDGLTAELLGVRTNPICCCAPEEHCAQPANGGIAENFGFGSSMVDQAGAAGGLSAGPAVPLAANGRKRVTKRQRWLNRRKAHREQVRREIFAWACFQMSDYWQKNGLSMRMAADLLGVSPSQLSRWTRAFKAGGFARIAPLLNELFPEVAGFPNPALSVEQVFGGKQP